MPAVDPTAPAPPPPGDFAAVEGRLLHLNLASSSSLGPMSATTLNDDTHSMTSDCKINRPTTKSELEPRKNIKGTVKIQQIEVL